MRNFKEVMNENKNIDMCKAIIHSLYTFYTNLHTKF